EPLFAAPPFPPHRYRDVVRSGEKRGSDSGIRRRWRFARRAEKLHGREQPADQEDQQPAKKIAPSIDRRDIHPPDIAPITKYGSSPLATASGRGVSGSSCDSSCWQA